MASVFNNSGSTFSGLYDNILHGNSSEIEGLFKNGIHGSDGLDDITIVDSEWVRSRFMIPDDEFTNKQIAHSRYASSAYWKFTDTSLGGNLGMNPRPQFTRYADIRYKQFKRGEAPISVAYTGKTTLGRYYSEAIDDNEQLIHLEFGLPKFNSVIDFFLSAVDYQQSIIANTGRQPTWYDIGNFAGSVAIFAMFPATSILIMAGKFLGRSLGILGGNMFRYYYLNPAMHMYWSSVSILVTMFASELGVLTPELMDKSADGSKIGMLMKFNEEDMRNMHALYPDLINNSGYIDVYAIAMRSQATIGRMLDKHITNYPGNEGASDSGAIPDSDDAFENLNKIMKETYNGEIVDSPSFNNDPSSTVGRTIVGIQKFIDSMNNSLFKELYNDDEDLSKADNIQSSTPSGGEGQSVGQAALTNLAGSNEKGINADREGRLDSSRFGWFSKFGDWMSDLKDYHVTALRDGGRFASLYVDYTGSVSDSFSNSTGPIGSETGAKSISTAARNVKFMLGGDGISGAINAGLGYVKDTLAGALDGVTFGLSGVMQALLGGAYIDLPNKWEDSETSLGSTSYSMTLISPSGDPISQIMNIYIPLSMILAGVLPKGTGKSSYGEPFLCSVFDRGVQTIKLGMITSVSITRGTSNLAFTKTRKPLAIEVSFTVTNLSTMLTTPIVSSIKEVFKITMDDDSPIGDYVATLCGRDHLTSKYFGPKLRMRASTLLHTSSMVTSSANWGMRTGMFFSNLTSNLFAQANAIKGSGYDTVAR